MKIAVYPGSFDPISNGHLDIITRAANIFDKLYVLVSINPNKQYIFSNDERVYMLKHATKDMKNVVVEASNKLVLQYARDVNASIIIRGVRNYNDYQAEMTLFQFNHSIDHNIDTFVLFPDTSNLFLSSSSIKELVLFGASIDNYVPKGLSDMIRNKIVENSRKIKKED